MIPALGILLAFQLAGEIAARALALPVPGPVLGLVLLVAFLLARQRAGGAGAQTIDDSDLGRTANGLLAMLGILFVPAGVGVTQHLPLLGEHGAALFAALAVSTAATLVVTVWVFVLVSRRAERKHAP